MIKSLTVTNPKGESLKMVLENPKSSGLIITGISGLGPSKATINSSELPTADGSVFSSARCSDRNIVIGLQMMEPDVEGNRQKTYKYFPIKKLVTLRIETDNRVADISGYVESNEPNIFAQQETTQISIICTDPNFYEVGSTEYAFYGVHPKFEFPFPEKGQDYIEFGEIKSDTRVVLDYIGDIDTGVLITIRNLGGDVNTLTIFNVDTREKMEIDTAKIETITGTKFGLGDEIIISTSQNSRNVYLLRDGIKTNMINILGRYPDWFQLTIGRNSFDFIADTDVKVVSMTFTFRNAYGGI